MTRQQKSWAKVIEKAPAARTGKRKPFDMAVYRLNQSRKVEGMETVTPSDILSVIDAGKDPMAYFGDGTAAEPVNGQTATTPPVPDGAPEAPVEGAVQEAGAEPPPPETETQAETPAPAVVKTPSGTVPAKLPEPPMPADPKLEREHKLWTRVIRAANHGTSNAVTGTVFRFNKERAARGAEKTTVKKVLRDGWVPEWAR